MAVAEPLTTLLRPGPSTSPARVAGALARTLAPAEADEDAPAWLWPEQHRSFRRTLAALRNRGGVLLAEPVGAGKTYVSLAVAAAYSRRPVICIVPAGLVDQWRTAAEQVGLSAVVWSHERASRGSLPESRSPLILIDESHHFRNPSTQRYRYLAPWLVGRRAILLSATPVVNSLADLAHQLALTLRDDVLRPSGVPSLMRLLLEGRGHPALGEVIVTRSPRGVRRPGAVERVVRLDDTALDHVANALVLIDRLRLSTHGPVAALIRAAFWRAAASSAPALAASLHRYRRLLLHAREAAVSGHALDRRSVRAMTGDLGDQLLFWELLRPNTLATDLVFDDLPLLGDLRTLVADACATRDVKLLQLQDLLADGRSTLVFAIARETVRYLREQLRGPVAWCTGGHAGIGRQSAPRAVVLGWFRPRRSEQCAEALVPRHLIATDVAAEGLDLHRAERIVHYDLPWTPARMDHREGRARRPGAAHTSVQVVRFEPPPVVETRLRQLVLLAHKRGLPSAAGLDESGRGLWRWRGDVSERFAELPFEEGVACLVSDTPGIVAGFELRSWPDAPAPPGSFVLWWDAQIGWTEDPDIVTSRLDAAARTTRDQPTRRGAIDAALVRVAEPIRLKMRELRRSSWLSPDAAPTAHRVVSRLQHLARRAVRRRDATALERLQRAIRFAAGGHTAGERARLAELADLPDPVLEASLAGLPAPAPDIGAIQPRLTGLIVFISGKEVGSIA